MYSRTCQLLKCQNAISQAVITADDSLFTRLARWRKRRWSPRAPSKIYYVRKPTPIIPEESEFLKPAYNNYRHAVKVLRLHFIEDRDNMILSETSKTALKKDADELALLYAANDNWNAETKIIRIARLAQAEKNDQAAEMQHLLVLEEEKHIETVEAARLVKLEKLRSKSFITHDTLDEAIEKALKQVSNYNYAIDYDGNRHIEGADGGTTLETQQQAATNEEGRRVYNYDTDTTGGYTEQIL